MSVDLRLGDCPAAMGDIPSDSIDLILTSPPYDNLRSYAAGHRFDFEGVAAECKRVLKPGGVIVWVVGDETRNGSESGTSFRQALHFKGIGLRLRDTMIYEKANPFHTGDRSHYQNAFEFMFVLTNGRPNVANVLREPCKQAGKVYASRRHRERGLSLKSLALATNPVRDTKPRPNIWTYVLRGKGHGHPAAFPLQLATDHVLSWTNPGDTVLDPFVGSGTTLEACVHTGRNGIGIDRSSEYIELARRRIDAALSTTPLLDDAACG